MTTRGERRQPRTGRQEAALGFQVEQEAEFERWKCSNAGAKTCLRRDTASQPGAHGMPAEYYPHPRFPELKLCLRLASDEIDRGGGVLGDQILLRLYAGVPWRTPIYRYNHGYPAADDGTSRGPDWRAFHPRQSAGKIAGGPSGCRPSRGAQTGSRAEKITSPAKTALGR